jgi:hypothetical protein
MFRFFGQVLGLFVGAIIGLWVSGHYFRCAAFIVARDNTEYALSGVGMENRAVDLLIAGGKYMWRCGPVSGHWSFDTALFGFTLVAWGVPLLFAFLGWSAVCRIWRKPTP